MTKAKFIEHPFKAGERLYRTGDLCRWDAHGNLEFLGREDEQVKINGYRIELHEVEACLLAVEGISQTLVMAYGTHTEKFLCAYFVAKEPIKSDDIKAYLAEKLPSYMIPLVFRQVEYFPVTPNGKIDKASLPSPFVHQRVEPPKPGTETALARIWSDVLNLPLGQIGRNSHFFESGGHSLKAITLIARIHSQLKIKLSLADIFRTPLLSEMAQALTMHETSHYEPIEAAARKEFYPVLFNQKRLWVLQELHKEDTSYNMELELGFQEVIRVDLFEEALKRLIARHESLRTGFRQINGELFQYVLDQVSTPLVYHDLMGRSDVAQEKRSLYALQSLPFDLERPPLIRCALLKTGEAEFECLMVIHHIVSDGKSIDILKRDFMDIYSRLDKGLELAPGPEIHYKDFAEWQTKKLGPEKRQQIEHYLKTQFNDPKAFQGFPRDFDHLSGKGSASYCCYLDTQLANKLLEFTGKQVVSPFAFFTATLSLFQSRLSGCAEVVFGAPSAGRNHEDLKDMVGFMVNTVLLKTEMDHSLDFAEFVRTSHFNYLEAIQIQDHQYERVLDDLSVTLPDVKIFLNMLNVNDDLLAEELPGFAPYHVEKDHEGKFDVTVYFSQWKNGFELRCLYNRNFYLPLSIENMMTGYMKLIKTCLDNPEKKLSGLLQANEQKKTFKRA